MTDALRGLDHALIAVADLEAARADWQRLGFRPTPRGRHQGRSTGNHCLMLPADYLELVGIVDSAGPPSRLSGLLQRRGQGLIGAALAPSDDAAAFAWATEAGLSPQPPVAFGRLLETPEGTLHPRFSLIELPAETVPDFRLFFCRHLTADLLRRPAWLGHPNTARRIAELAIVTADPERLARPLGRLFGGAQWRDGILWVSAGDARLGFGTAEALAGPMGSGANGLLALEVADLDMAERQLEATGIAYRRGAGNALCVGPAFATGVALEFRG
ncbi:MAG: VOC family protein [Alphaproteobacteria bacterium]|nr:VOC family protein [Alphaproteobacteria bacterium]